MTELRKTGNCGVAEIYFLSSADDSLHALKSIAPQLKKGIIWDNREVKHLFPFVTFTGVVHNQYNPEHKNYAQAFADFLTENNLGVVTTLPGERNWTGKDIQLWLWRPNYSNIWALLAKESMVWPLP